MRRVSSAAAPGRVHLRRIQATLSETGNWQRCYRIDKCPTRDWSTLEPIRDDVVRR